MKQREVWQYLRKNRRCGGNSREPVDGTAQNKARMEKTKRSLYQTLDERKLRKNTYETRLNLDPPL